MTSAHLRYESPRDESPRDEPGAKRISRIRDRVIHVAADGTETDITDAVLRIATVTERVGQVRLLTIECIAFDYQETT